MSRVGLQQFRLFYPCFSHDWNFSHNFIHSLLCNWTQARCYVSGRGKHGAAGFFSGPCQVVLPHLFPEESALCLFQKETFFSLQHIGGRQNVSEISQCHLYYLEINLSCKMNFLSQNSESAFPLRFDFLTTHESNNFLVFWGSLALLYLCFFECEDTDDLCQRLNNDRHWLQEPLF